MISNDRFGIIGIGTVILANITLFLLCLSNEKEEDEYVMHVRMGIIKKLACFWFVVSLFEYLSIQCVMHIDPISLFKLMSVTFPLTNIYTLALVYIIWLKVSLWRIRKEAARD